MHNNIYKIFLSEDLKKEQEILLQKDKEKIKKIISKLSENPRPFKCKKLKGDDQEYRIRYRNRRILYTIDDKNKKVIVHGIPQRKEAYK